MKKTIIYLFSLIALVIIPSVYAQPSSTEKWTCLQGKEIGPHTGEVSVNPQKKLVPSSTTYIVECLSRPTAETANAEDATGTVDSKDVSIEACTSGDSAVDLELFGNDNLNSSGITDFLYEFHGSTLPSNPTMSDADGMILPFRWNSYTEDNHFRRWMAINFLDATGTGVQGNTASLQQGSFPFESVAKLDSTCLSIVWDPFGRIFDSRTLEPVSGATVTLLVKRNDGTFTKLDRNEILSSKFVNPQITKVDGTFSFVVPDGVYKLSVTHPNFTFPSELSAIHPRYITAYYDIYPAATREEIVQAGSIQHRDIPIAPLGVSQTNDAKLMEYMYHLDKESSTIYVKGRSSHPLSQITAYSLKPDPILKKNARYRLLTKTPVIADRLGIFNLVINQAEFEPTENFGDIVVTKVDLTDPNNKVVSKASNSRVNAIPNFLTGYAYDSQGKVIPNALVSVILSFSKKPFSTTKANAEGFFTLTSDLLPAFEYRLTFTAPTSKKVTTVSPAQFIVQNQGAIEAVKMKVNAYIKTEVVITPPGSDPSNATSSTSRGNQNGYQSNGGANRSTTDGSGQQTGGSAFQSQSSKVLLSIIVIVVLILFAVIAFMYTKKKSSTF